jgi:hypothetical protein
VRANQRSILCAKRSERYNMHAKSEEDIPESSLIMNLDSTGDCGEDDG